MRPVQWLLVHLLFLFWLYGAITGSSFLAASLLSKLDTAMRIATRYMQRRSYVLPLDFNMGGGCYTGFGESLRFQDCQVALAMIPGVRPGDIAFTARGILVRPEFRLGSPLVWSHGSCSIGVSVRNSYASRGLYSTFAAAARLILGRCVGRGHGGMVRFGFFEVVIFDNRLLPRTGPDCLPNFISNIENLPFSNGLARLWRARTLQ